jgi:hypothetical protein
MSFNFQLDEDEEENTQTQQAPAQFVNPLLPQGLQPARQQPTQEQKAAVEEFLQEQEPEAFDAQMSEAERRLEKAMYYRVLLNQQLFSENSDISSEIESELREFIKQRLGILLGMVPEMKVSSVPSQFTDEEVTVLREVAAKLSKSPHLMPKQKEPPQLNAVKGPQKPTFQQVAPPTQKARSQTQNTQPTQQTQRKVPGPKKKKGATGEFMTVDGVDYEKYLDEKLGEYYISSTGQKYVMTTVPEGENAGKIFMRNITGQAVSKNRAPSPMTPAQMTAQSEAHATAALAASGRALQSNQTLGGIINHVLKK